ncbi:oxidoreductase [Auriculariales sp. MPI-PUGE-AT-0066]|nr:oxidoreductase [Auriculariales sp. MPI-PUGE-AT-0066]
MRVLRLGKRRKSCPAMEHGAYMPWRYFKNITATAAAVWDLNFHLKSCPEQVTSLPFPTRTMPQWTPAGKHCYVTGGSQGLGLEVARQLVAQGAHVSIVARDQAKLDAALKSLNESRVSEKQILQAFSFSLSDPVAADAAIVAASAAHDGRLPDAFLLCAGSARPGFFIEQSTQDLRDGFENAFWCQAHTAHAAAKRLVKARESRGKKIVMTGSILANFGLVGYSPYSPAKYALRGLADNLRSELLLYGIDVQMYFPSTIYSPGYENENKTKPEIVLKIEERDVGDTPEVCARIMLKGVAAGNAHITGDFNGHVFRVATRGAVPWNNFFVDIVYGCIAFFGIPDWRRGVDKRIRGHAEEHEKYLQARGYYED